MGQCEVRILLLYHLAQCLVFILDIEFFVDIFSAFLIYHSSLHIESFVDIFQHV